MKNNKRRKGIIFSITEAIVRIFYRRRKFVGLENLPTNSSIIVGNHAQVHGPLSCQLFFPNYKYIWCIGQMMKIREVPAYAYVDFWSHKPRWSKWFYRLLSYIIAPISAYYLSRADTIAVYKDARLLSTYRETIEKMNDGANIIIFPEKAEKYNDIVNEFQDKFVDVAKLYYKKYGKEVDFVPMYNAAKIKTIILGKPIKYNPNIDIEEQRKIICDHLKNEITYIAKELPTHVVVPYDNINKKLYKKSK